MPLKVEVVLTPAEIALLPPRDLSAATCVVFDVLRATSTILTALAHGARRVFPVLSVEEARQRQRETPQALLGGERGGTKIEGFDLGNSPREYAAETVAGRDILTTTTNGTVALRACASAKTVLAGAWLNLDALASFLTRPENATGHLLLVCAGTGSRFAAEDGLAAGALLDRLAEHETGMLPDDAALAMSALHGRWRERPRESMLASENGKRLVELGLAADVDWCAHTCALPWVGVMRDGVLTGLRVRTD